MAKSTNLRVLIRNVLYTKDYWTYSHSDKILALEEAQKFLHEILYSGKLLSGKTFMVGTQNYHS